MSFEGLLARDVVIVSPGSTTDRYGDTTADWSSSSSRPARAWFAQQRTNGTVSERNGVVVEGHAVFDLSSNLAAGERVVLDGLTYDVIGVPNVASTPRGPHHLEADLKAVIG